MSQHHNVCLVWKIVRHVQMRLFAKFVILQWYLKMVSVTVQDCPIVFNMLTIKPYAHNVNLDMK
jgi:hypothetical protein